MSKIFTQSIHHGLINNGLPLRQYFLLVGGALLALLFAIDAITPRQPAIESGDSGPRLPRIRIHSAQKGPEAVVIDTSRAIAVPTLAAQVDAAKTVTSPDPQVTENVAQPVSPSVRQADAKELSKAERKPQPHSRVARGRTRRPPVSYAQRPEFGPFDRPWTFDQQNVRIRDSFAQMFPRRQRQGGARPRFGWSDAGW